MERDAVLLPQLLVKVPVLIGKLKTSFEKI